MNPKELQKLRLNALYALPLLFKQLDAFVFYFILFIISMFNIVKTKQSFYALIFFII